MKRGQLDMMMANKTPLSIAHAKPGNAKPAKSKGKAYEENMREKTFGDSKPDFAFKDGYREPPDMTLKDKAFHLSSQMETLDSEASLWDKDLQGIHNVRFSGHKESIDSHSSTSSPKEEERRNGRLITPPLTSSAESSYSPPSIMKEQKANQYISPKDLLFASAHSALGSPNKENIPTASQLSKDHQPLMSSSVEPTKPRPPTPCSTITSHPSNDEAVGNIFNKSTRVDDETYRRNPQSSDADDEDEDEDLEIKYTDDEDEEDADLANPDGNFCSADKDDEGLHGQLEAVTISPRKRRLDAEEDQDEEALRDGDSNTSNNGSGEEEDLKAKVREENKAFYRTRQRRNAITEEDKKVIEEFQRVKRVKTGVEEALVVSTASEGDLGMGDGGDLDGEKFAVSDNAPTIPSTTGSEGKSGMQNHDEKITGEEGRAMIERVEGSMEEL